ncbi:MAG: proteasome accessory factor PafA2 family protein [Fimbriimonadaceae bacterium]|nr:proteasome accessory factor PafA2 family protein [Fimbriimonadaceae bacterium]
MDRPRTDRVFGVETEYGCLVADENLGSPEAAVELIKDYVFFDMKLGAMDIHSRDEVFEPAQCGGFLMNGARLYIDAVGSHLEYATAECRSLKDLVANDRAGQRHIVRAIRELDLVDDVCIYNNSVDHFGGHTFGCHENYLVEANDELLTERVEMFYPFLVTRQIYAGVGRVGGHVLSANAFRPNYQEVVDNPIDYIWVSHVYGVLPDDSVNYQLSQRADHILKTIASRVRFNRAIINPKWEHFYTYGGRTRLHLLYGEANQNEYAYALKVGTTSLVVALLEENAVPQRLLLSQPVFALRTVSRDDEYKWLVELADGTTITAIDLQREYLKLAERFRGESEQTDWILNEWAAILDGLEKDPMALADKVDWVAKKKVVEQYMESEGLGWQDDALQSIDLEYHNIDPDQSLFHALQEMGQTERMLDDLDIVDAMTDPPQNTRAKGRAKLVREVMARKGRKYYAFDWNGVSVDQLTYVEMPDPYETYDES